MAVSMVIEFGGAPDDLIWKYPQENIPASSRLIVDETHQVLVVINGQVTDLLGAGPHELNLPSLSAAGKLERMVTGGDNPFPCKLFFVSQVHQSNLLWGTQGGPIVVKDPLYDIFLHVMMHGSIYYSVTDARKLLLKLVGFRDRFGAEDVTAQFRGIINLHVKNVIGQIMVKGGLSFFALSANLMELSQVVQEQLAERFDEYGVGINYFNIETVEVPDDDYAELSASKQKAAALLAEGTTWQQEREMMILEKFAENPGAADSMLMMGSSFGQIARMAAGMNVVSGMAAGGMMPPPTAAPAPAPMSAPAPAPMPAPAAAPAPQQGGTVICKKCGAQLGAGSRFCNFCGERVETVPVCPSCGIQLAPNSLFCNQCGTRVG